MYRLCIFFSLLVIFFSLTWCFTIPDISKVFHDCRNLIILKLKFYSKRQHCAQKLLLTTMHRSFYRMPWKQKGRLIQCCYSKSINFATVTDCCIMWKKITVEKHKDGSWRMDLQFKHKVLRPWLTHLSETLRWFILECIYYAVLK